MLVIIFPTRIAVLAKHVPIHIHKPTHSHLRARLLAAGFRGLHLLLARGCPGSKVYPIFGHSHINATSIDMKDVHWFSISMGQKQWYLGLDEDLSANLMFKVLIHILIEDSLQNHLWIYTWKMFHYHVRLLEGKTQWTKFGTPFKYCGDVWRCVVTCKTTTCKITIRGNQLHGVLENYCM